MSSSSEKFTNYKDSRLHVTRAKRRREIQTLERMGSTSEF
jgi:hypothetical protein